MSYSFIAPKKDPAAVLDYAMSWSNWLAEGESVSQHEVTCSDESIVISDVSEVDGVVRFRCAGGIAGADVLVTVEITTNSGQSDQRTIRIPVRER